jgi:cell division protein ZapA
MTSRVVHVNIQGQRYALRSDLDPAYISDLAGYVDEKMRQAANEIQSADSLRVAVVAALNVADELFRARADGSGVEDRVLARTAEIERLVDAALDGAADQAGGARDDAGNIRLAARPASG